MVHVIPLWGGNHPVSAALTATGWAGPSNLSCDISQHRNVWLADSVAGGEVLFFRASASHCWRAAWW
jgi:hypothetical protein